MKRLMTLITLSIALSHISPASACISDPSGWNYQSHQAAYSLDERAPYLILNGFVGELSLDELRESVEVIATRDGEEILGELDVSPGRGTLIWRPEIAPEPDVEYTVTISSQQEYGPEPIVNEVTTMWPSTPLSTDEISLRSTTTDLFDSEVYGDCLDLDEWGDFCGGCPRDVIDTEEHWRVEAAVEIDRGFNQFILGRIAVGADEREALDKLQEQPHLRLSVEDATYLMASGGLREGWGDEACLALEVIRPNGDALFNTTECFEIPHQASVDAEADTESDRPTDMLADASGGCDMTTAAPRVTATWALMLSFLFGWYRRRALQG